MLAEAQTAQHERGVPLPVQLFKRVDGYAKALLCCGAFLPQWRVHRVQNPVGHAAVLPMLRLR